MNNQTKEIIKESIIHARETQKPFIKYMTNSSGIILLALVTADTFSLYQSDETDDSVRKGAYSVVEYNEKGYEVTNRSGWLKYTYSDDNGSYTAHMTLEEKVEYDLAELLDDPSISGIYALVKEHKQKKKAIAQSNYRQRKLSSDDTFKEKENIKRARSQAKLYISHMAGKKELQTLKKLIAEREKTL